MHYIIMFAPIYLMHNVITIYIYIIHLRLLVYTQYLVYHPSTLITAITLLSMLSTNDINNSSSISC